MNSIGASSISPSPLTTLPSIGSLLSSRRMASTAAWSEALSLPWPRKRAEDTAARSVTRTISRVRMRSSNNSGWTVMLGILTLPSETRSSPKGRSVLLNPYDLWPARDHPIAPHRRTSLTHRIFGGCISNENNGDGTRFRVSTQMRRIMALHNRFDRNVLLGKPFGNSRCGARLVAGDQPNVIAAFMPLHRRLSHVSQPCGRPSERSSADTPRDIANICQDGRSCRCAPSPGSHQRQRIDVSRIDRHCIGHAHHLGDRGILAHHGRMHALLYPFWRLDRHAQELHPVAQLIRSRKVGRRNRRYALDVDRVLVNLVAECETGEDCELLRGVVALDIEAGIGLGVTKPLRFLQTFVERDFFLLHPRQDVVAGAVQDAVDALERITGHSFPQCLYDRNGSAHRRLKIQGHVLAFRHGRKLDAVPGEQGLVCGHDGLAGRKCRFDRTSGRLPAPADQFDKYIDAGFTGERLRIAEPLHFPEVDTAILAA